MSAVQCCLSTRDRVFEYISVCIFPSDDLLVIVARRRMPFYVCSSPLPWWAPIRLAPDRRSSPRESASWSLAGCRRSWRSSWDADRDASRNDSRNCAPQRYRPDFLDVRRSRSRDGCRDEHSAPNSRRDIASLLQTWPSSDEHWDPESHRRSWHAASRAASEGKFKREKASEGQTTYLGGHTEDATLVRYLIVLVGRLEDTFG